MLLRRQWQTIEPAMGAWVAKLGAAPDESDEDRLRKTLILVFAGVKSGAGLIWGAFLYLLSRSLLVVAPPFGYALLSLLNVVQFDRTRHFARFRFVQLLLSLFLPFWLMVVLGGIVQGGATILWSLIAPLGVLLVDSRRSCHQSQERQKPVRVALLVAALRRAAQAQGISESAVDGVAPPSLPIMSEIAGPPQGKLWPPSSRSTFTRAWRTR